MLKASMKPRERVLAALNHQEPDRVPIDLGNIKLPAYLNLLKYFRIENRETGVADIRGQAAQVDEDVLRRLGVDFRTVKPGAPDRMPDTILRADGDGKALGISSTMAAGDSYRDEWGVVRRRPAGSVGYELVYCPFAEDGTLSALERHEWPDADDPGRYRGLREKARRLYEETDCAIVLDVRCSCFIRAAEMRGLENFFMDLVDNQEFAGALMDRLLDIKLAIAERALEEAGDFIHVVIVNSDDLGMTTGPLISLNTYRKMIKPRHKRMFDLFKARTGAKRYMHSDGSVHRFVEDLIEIGLEVLDPVQVSCEGMDDTRLLKERFGSRLTFHGAIDTRDVLPHGSPDDVRREVQRRIQDLAPGGGYIVAPVASVMPEVPPENLVAMFEAAKELGRYPLGR